ncbi:MAG: cation transporter [Treponema sp.]|nr:cation transporter [Treponema sp.]
MKTLLKIEGMSCENCVKHVKEALEALEGVSSAQVSLDEHSAEVEHSDQVSLDLLNETVEEAGYQTV